MPALHRRLLAWSLVLSSAWAASPSSYEIAHPFRSVAGWLCSHDEELEGRETAVKRALLLLSKTHLVTKGVDGAGFHLQASVGAGSAARANLRSEIDKLLESREDEPGEPATESRRMRPTVAAAKLVHKARTAQEGLRSAELLELTDEARHVLRDSPRGADPYHTLTSNRRWMRAARHARVKLRAPIAVPLSPLLKEHGVNPGRPRDPPELLCLVLDDLWSAEGEDQGPPAVIVTVSDTVACHTLVGALEATPVPIKFTPMSASSMPLHLQPDGGSGEDEASDDAGECESFVAPVVLRSAQAVLEPLLGWVDGEDVVPCSLRFVGHSFGAAVAAVLCGLLSESLACTGATPELESESELTENRDWRRRVKATCLALGPCPCVGATLPLPGVTSLVLGDDFIARAQPSSLMRLKHRLQRMLPQSHEADVVEGVKAAAQIGSAWFADTFSSTLSNFNQRSTLDSKRRHKPSPTKVDEDAELEGGNVEMLLCPGLVYLLKPRSTGEVAMVTTKRGGFGEAVLWQMHETLMSKSMLAHHTLEAYVQSLGKA